jgi:hypothetical protein
VALERQGRVVRRPGPEGAELWEAVNERAAA